MARHNIYRIFFIVFYFLFFNYVYANEIIDKMNGIWVDSKRQNYVLSIQKINNDLYFVNYSDNIDNHNFDFHGVAKVYNNKLYIKLSEDDYYFIYYEEDFDSVYVLWNHDYPSDDLYDLPLKSVTKIFDEEYLIKKQKEQEDSLKEAIKSYLKNSAN